MKQQRLSESHKMFCLKCGRAGIPIVRKKNRCRTKGHLKLMYCPYCKMYINHFEARNEYEEEDFKRRFANGEFEELAKESEEYLDEMRDLL